MARLWCLVDGNLGWALAEKLADYDEVTVEVVARELTVVDPDDRRELPAIRRAQLGWIPDAIYEGDKQTQPMLSGKQLRTKSTSRLDGGAGIGGTVASSETHEARPKTWRDPPPSVDLEQDRRDTVSDPVARHQDIFAWLG